MHRIALPGSLGERSPSGSTPTVAPAQGTADGRLGRRSGGVTVAISTTSPVWGRVDPVVGVEGDADVAVVFGWATATDEHDIAGLDWLAAEVDSDAEGNLGAGVVRELDANRRRLW